MVSLSELRAFLKRPTTNLSAIARDSSVPLRTLRRIKNGEGAVLTDTVERIEPWIKKGKR